MLTATKSGVALLLASLLSAGCGNSSFIGSGSASVFSISPTTLAGSSGGRFTIDGGDYSQVVGTDATLRIMALGGAMPFAGGSSATMELPVDIASATTVEGVMPPICVPGDSDVEVTFQLILPSGVETPMTGSTMTISGPRISGFLPITDLMCPGATFTVQGSGFGPVPGTATVTFRALSGATPFAGGTSSTLVVSGATITSDMEIEGLLSDPGVAGPVLAAVSVDLDCGATVTGGLAVVARFNVPTVTAFAPTATIGGPGVAFTVTGTGFEPVPGVATVTFTAPAPMTPFSNGTSATLVVPNATVDSATQVSGVSVDPAAVARVEATVTVTLACGKSATGGAGVVATFDKPGVEGIVEYEFVPHIAIDPSIVGVQPSGLDYSAIETRQVAGARVQAVRISDQTVLASTGTSPAGAYRLDVDSPDPIVIRVLAESHIGPPMKIVDNTNGNATWAFESGPLTVGASRRVQDLLATTGWDGAAYSGPRAAAPMSIFCTLRTAAVNLLNAVSPQPVLAPLEVRWSPANNQASAFWNGSYIMLRGADGIDTDEFDTHLLVHEWGHYFEATQSRSDSIGGQHFFGRAYDVSLAWGEGWASALAAILLDPDSVYSDTKGAGNAGGFQFDVEQRGAVFASASLGWFNEWTIWELVYDLADATNEGVWDSLSLGLSNLYRALAGGQANTDAFTTIYSFIETLKADNPADAAAIDTMCFQHAIVGSADRWGTGEINSRGIAANLPVYKTLTINAAPIATVLNRGGNNELESVKIFRFTGNGAAARLVTTSPVGDATNRFGWNVFRRGQSVLGVSNQYYWFTEPGAVGTSVSFATVAGEEYTIRLRHFGLPPYGGGGTPGTYAPTIQVVSP